MKVVCFLFDPNVGGPTIRARQVYEKMIADGHDVRIAIPDGEGSAHGYLSEKSIPVDRLAISKPVPPRNVAGFLNYLLRFPLNIGRVVRYLRNNNPDIAHVNGAFDLVPAIGAKFSAVPLVWHLNDTVFGKATSRMLGRLVRLLANQIAIASKRVGTHYGVSGSQVSVLYAPVDVSFFTPREQAGFPRSEPNLGLLANWNWIKGQDRFVEVINTLRNGGHNVKGTIVGRFVERQKNFWEPVLRNIKSLGLDGTIHRPGFMDDVRPELSRMDLVLLTSHSEACPICVLEAMAAGVPLVVFDAGGVKEMMGVEEGETAAAGIVVPEGDIKAMAEAVEKLLADKKLYDRCGDNGRRRAVERFSVAACVERHINIYNAAIA